MKNLSESGPDFLYIVVSKEEILKRNIEPALQTLNNLILSPASMKFFRGKVDISVDGYNEDNRELWEIEEVRNYINALDEKFPYWLYFLSTNHHGLNFIIRCFLLPFLIEDGKKKHHPKQLSEYLLNRGFPAMNHLCKISLVSEEEIKRLTEKITKYIFKI